VGIQGYILLQLCIYSFKINVYKYIYNFRHNRTKLVTSNRPIPTARLLLSVTPRPPVLQKEGQPADLYASNAEMTSGAIFTRIPTDIGCNYREAPTGDLCCVSSRDSLTHCSEKQPCGSCYCHTSSKDHGSRPCHV